MSRNFFMNVLVDFKTKVSGKFDEVRRQMQRTAQPMRDVNQRLRELSAGSVDGRKKFKRLSPTFNNLSTAADAFGVSVGRMKSMVSSGQFELFRLGKTAKTTSKNLHLVRMNGNDMVEVFTRGDPRIRNLSKGFKKINFHMFGALFLGMQIHQTFMGIFRGSKLLSGIFDSISTIISAALLPAFMPLALMLLDVALAFLSWPEPIRKVIGFVIPLIGLFGLFTMIIGLLSLSWGGLVAAAGPAAILLAGFVGIMLLLKSVMDDANFGVFSFRNNLKSIFNAISLGTAGPLAEFFEMVTGIDDIWSNLADTIQGVILLIKEFVGIVPEGTFDAFISKTLAGREGEGIAGEGLLPTTSDVATTESELRPRDESPPININVEAGLNEFEISNAVNEELSRALRGAGIQ